MHSSVLARTEVSLNLAASTSDMSAAVQCGCVEKRSNLATASRTAAWETIWAAREWRR